MNNENQEIEKPNVNKYSREIAMPVDVAERYMMYCKITKMKLSEPLRVLVMESTPQLHNAANLDQVIDKTKNREFPGEYHKFHVRLPGEVIAEINTYCKFFGLTWRRCHFLYFLIEEKLLKRIEGVLDNE